MRPGRIRPSGLTVTVTIAFFTLIALGSWQLQRRAEKLQLIARYEEGIKGFAQPFPSESLWPSTDFTALVYRKVVLEGRYVQPALRLYNLLPQIEGRAGGMGWDIIQPFQINGGGLVLINRGFMPAGDKSTFFEMPEVLARDRKLEGIVRASERRTWLTPENSPQKNQWYTRDVKAFTAQMGLDPQHVAPVVIEQLTPNDDALPQPGDGKLQFSNRHLGYALTWFSLAIVLVVVFVVYRRKQRRLSVDASA